MPESMIYKHTDYMKESGIDLQLIITTLRTLTALQEITTTLKKQFLRTQPNTQIFNSQNNHLNLSINLPHSAPLSQRLNTSNNQSQSLNSKGQMRHQLNQQIQTDSFSDKIIPFNIFSDKNNIFSDKNNIQTKHQQSIEHLNFILSPKNQLQTIKMQQTYQQIDYLIESIHHDFVDYYKEVITLTYMFIKWRLLDICGKFGANSRTWEKLVQKKPYLNNTKNLFLKAHFLQDYLINVKVYFSEIIQSYPIANYYLTNPNEQLSLLEVEVGSLRTEIELDYSQKNKISASRAVRQLRNLVEITTVKPIGSPFLLGFWVAAVILIILGIVFILEFFDINFTTNNHFQRTFPIWRGLWYFIFLIWLMGVNTYIFNYYKINFNLLTAFNNYHLPNPSRLIICGAIFTSIHFLLFLFYLIKLAELGNNVLNNLSQDFIAGISWLLFLCFFIIPLRYFYFRQRLYPFMMFFRSIVSPIIGVEFKFSIFMQLFVSFRQPIRDMIYTFTYYFIDNEIIYWDTIMYETITGIILYSFRIVQNCRMMYQNRLCGGMPIYSITKSLLGFITMITSYLSKNQTSHDYFYLYIWLLTALASTSLAYYMDLWNDWGLLEPKYGYLRKTLIYRNKNFYYTIIFLNLILRFVWMLNVSPDVLRRIPMKPYIVVMIVSSIEITRRGIWMIFRVQKQHISSENALNKLFIIEDYIQKQSQSHIITNPKQSTFKNSKQLLSKDSKQSSFTISKQSSIHIEKELTQQNERELSPQNQIDPLPPQQKELIIKSPNWLQIKLKAQDKIKKSNINQLLLKNSQKIAALYSTLSEADKIVQKYFSEQQKFLRQ